MGYIRTGLSYCRIVVVIFAKNRLENLSYLRTIDYLLHQLSGGDIKRGRSQKGAARKKSIDNFISCAGQRR